MRHSIEAFSERVGCDPSLVQAAGGNVSWKDGDTLWVKSSGAWLSNARQQDMFVPLDLAGVRACIASGRENYVDYRCFDSTLRPSIETALHALMPQTVVAHLHAIDAIALAVLRSGRERLAERLAGIDWLWVPYCKPGAMLASRVADLVDAASHAPDVLVLANHGIVFCGIDVDAVESLQREVLERLRVDARSPLPAAPAESVTLPGYTASTRPATIALACDPIGLALVRERWVLYPDHAVFLGPAARIYETPDDALDDRRLGEASERARRPCVVIEGEGVWLPADGPRAVWDMLDCYADVCLRLPAPGAVEALDAADVAALLDWEPEHYRKSLAR